jgi:hypothetical protein
MFVTYPSYIREKAVEMRHAGMTLDEITERLALPRTTVFYWIRDIPIPPRPRTATPGRRKGNEKMVATFKAKRDAAYVQGRAEFEELAQLPNFIDFVCMYIGEGYKRNRNTVSLANSDPHVIRLATYWIRRFTNRKVSFMVQYHADQDVDALVWFWATHVGVASEDIRLQRKSNSNQLKGRTWRSVHGVLTVATNDTYLRARLQAWIDCVKERWLESVVRGA